MSKLKTAVRGRIGRMVAIGATLVGVSLSGLAVAPAQAVTDMQVSLTMGFVPAGVVNPSDPEGTLAQWTVFIPTDSGWGYLYNGGSVTVDCYGDDPGTDTRLLHVVHTMNTPVQTLWADDSGIHLHGWYGADRGTLFNEDTDGIDEIYCKMTWRDGDGGTITRTTATWRANF